MPAITIVQIALKQYGLDPFRAFVDSYRRHSAGVSHQLVIALKGFDDQQDAAPFLSLLEDIEHTSLHVPDGGLDIGTYFYVATIVLADTFLFFNSRTTIDATDYARKLLACLEAPGIGAVGATASWQSLASDRRRASHANPVLRPVWKLKGLLHSWWWLSFFPPFPNPHLRTNGLMIRRATLDQLKVRPIRSKMTAMRFESGWNGLTRQLARRGLGIRLVDRDGKCWSIADWRTAGVFWTGGQRGLMINDNQTDRYAGSLADERSFLESLAWGVLPLR